MRRTLTPHPALALTAALLWATLPALATDDAEPAKLLGPCSPAQLDHEPFAEWYRPGYDDYAPNPTVLDALARTDLAGVEATIFGPRQVLDYLARYTHRVALTNDRLLGFDQGLVRLRWRDYVHGGKQKVLRLAPLELLRRFILHVLPRGFQRIRHYGLLGNRHKAVKLAACRRYFGSPDTTPRSTDSQDRTTPASLARIDIDPDRCHACGSCRMRREPLRPVRIIPRARAPTAVAS